MSGVISSTTRNDDGLYTLTVEFNNKTKVLDTKFVRFDTTGSLLPSEVEEKELQQIDLDRMNGKKQKPEDKIPTFAKRLRSQIYLGLFNAFMEKDGNNARAVKAVYIPIKQIKSDVDAKRVLAFLHSMFMTEKDVHGRLVQVTQNDPSKFDENNDDIVFGLFTSALYTPQFRLPYDVPSTAAQDGITGDNRDLIRASYEPQTIPTSPVVPSSSTKVNPLFIVLALLVIAAIIYYAMRK